MNDQKIYNLWKERKTKIKIQDDFTLRVMNKISEYEQEKPKHLFDLCRFIELISINPLAKAGLIVAGTVAGFIKVAFAVYMFLGC